MTVRQRAAGHRRWIPSLPRNLLVACALIWTSVMAKSSRRILHWELQPTAVLGEEQRQERRRRRLNKRGRANETDITMFSLPQHWFHSKQNAVYATIPDAADPEWVQEDDPQWHDFQSHRHLSRYERQYRLETGQDLQIGWNGTYQYICNETEVATAFASHRRTREQPSQGSSSSRPSSSQEQSRAGGQFNNYQAVPLSQGYGTHFASVWVGSPTPQRKTVIVDTGSHYTAFPCTGCHDCGRPHHTDPYFAPTQSTTFHKLQCDECKDGVVCESGECTFSQAYTEGSSWTATQVQDRFYCGGTDVLDSAEPGDEKYAIDYMFGCQTSMRGLFKTQLADGIMGMSAHRATLPKQLYDKQLLEHNMFAMCYRRELGTSKRGVTAGSLTLGGVSSNLDTSPMVYARNVSPTGWYTIYVKNIYVRSGGGQTARSIDPNHRTIKVRIDPNVLNSGKGVIVDSGTTDTYLNKQVMQEFSLAWKKATGKPYSNTAISLTDEQLRSLPTILIQCQAHMRSKDPSIESYDEITGYAGKLDPEFPGDVLIAIPATSYMDYSLITKFYSSRIYFTESQGGVIGSNAMQGHNVVFDWGNGRVGFAESPCSYDKKNVPSVAEDEGFATDCEIDSPVLSQSCIESVDRRMCKSNPTNIALLGQERWTAVVKSPGNDAGLTCIDATKDALTKNPWDEPVINCDGQGTCEERRPCQLTCTEASKAADAIPLSRLDARQKTCGDAVWSACDYGCRQVWLESVAYSDGLCHEKTRESRHCHVGACARSDPCQVPYIVHVVFAFHGASVHRWTLQAEYMLTAALANAARKLSHTYGQVFEAGDVNVLLALPWYVNDDGGQSAPSVDTTDSEVRGMKVTLEISVPNLRVDSLTTPVGAHESTYETLSDGPVQSMLRNITNSITKREKMNCDVDQVFKAAKKALDLNNIFRGDRMMRYLIDEMRDIERNSSTVLESSPFDSVYKRDPFGTESRLISSWTVRTQVGSADEINYLGPPRPLRYRMVWILHLAFTLALGAVFLWSLIWFLVICYEKIRVGKVTLPFSSGRQRYSSLDLRESTASYLGKDLEDEIMGGDLELTPRSSNYDAHRRRVPLKRRTTITSDTR